MGRTSDDSPQVPPSTGTKAAAVRIIEMKTQAEKEANKAAAEAAAERAERAARSRKRAQPYQNMPFVPQ